MIFWVIIEQWCTIMSGHIVNSTTFVDKHWIPLVSRRALNSTNFMHTLRAEIVDFFGGIKKSFPRATTTNKPFLRPHQWRLAVKSLLTKPRCLILIEEFWQRCRIRFYLLFRDFWRFLKSPKRYISWHIMKQGVSLFTYLWSEIDQ